MAGPGGETGDTLAASNCQGRHIRSCWPNDGTNVGIPVTDDITIGNTAPTVTSVASHPIRLRHSDHRDAHRLE